jgi:uncharacterized protein
LANNKIYNSPEKYKAMRKLSLEDKGVFDSVFGKLSFPLQELNFKWIFLNSVMYSDMEWAEINGNVCLFLTFENARYIYPILPGEKLPETVNDCFAMADEYCQKHKISALPSIAYIPEELSSQYSALKGFVLKPQSQDYVYNAKELVALEGPAYKDKRNARNNLLKNNKVLAEPYSKKHEAECLAMLQRWKVQKEQNMPEDAEAKFKAEADFAEHVLKKASELDIPGLVVYVNGLLEGFTFGVKANEKMCSVWVEKTSLFIKGMPPFIFTEFVRQCFPECEFVNAGEDWGVEYLKVAKMSYHPAMVHKFYSLFRQ